MIDFYTPKFKEKDAFNFDTSIKHFQAVKIDWPTFGSVLNFTKLASQAKCKTESNSVQSKLTPSETIWTQYKNK